VNSAVISRVAVATGAVRIIDSAALSVAVGTFRTDGPLWRT
jgi:hypothetical protein